MSNENKFPLKKRKQVYSYNLNLNGHSLGVGVWLTFNPGVLLSILCRAVIIGQSQPGAREGGILIPISIRISLSIASPSRVCAPAGAPLLHHCHVGTSVGLGSLKRTQYVTPIGLRRHVVRRQPHAVERV